jgi:hypothetical protein
VSGNNHDHLWGPSAPLWFGMGEVTLHKERRPWSNTKAMARAIFT